MRKVYICDPHCYDRHYTQKGGGTGNFPVYIGSGVQRGHGIGGLFSGLAKMAIPLLKTAGKTLLQSGARFAGDLIRGKNVKLAAKKHALEAGKNIGRNVLSSVQDMVQTPSTSLSLGGNKKRKANTSTTSVRRAKRRRTSKTNSSKDIFG
jgi:hypothetical protein